MEKNKYPPAYPHDAIAELFPDVFWVHGSIKMAPGLRINRNMLVVRNGSELILVNPVRLNDVEESKLLELGSIKHVVRLGDFHGLDDAYYVDTFNAEFWCQTGQLTYTSPSPDHVISEAVAPPIEDAGFFVFSSTTVPEAALLLKDKRLLITTDAIQYYTEWTRTSLLARLMLPLLGFKKDLIIGPPWLKKVTPKGGSMCGDFERLLELEFDHLIAAHGSLLRDNAKSRLKEVVNNRFH
ncbi:MAG: hypothetical protein KUG71_03640 [Porticoccaceae bacterium]|nr:hypothetical protein [Porticoccaceae bacterium]